MTAAGAALRVGVVGLGEMGGFHAALVQQFGYTCLARVCDIDARRLDSWRDDGVPVTREPAEVVADPGVDAVIVASSDASHRDLVSGCLDAGKPVLCEKPLTLTAADSLAIVQREVALGHRLVRVGFMRRSDPPYQQLRARLRSGDRRVLLVRSVHRNPPASVFAAEAMVASSVPHDVDVARWLLDDEPVAATAHQVRAGDTDASGAVLLVLRTRAGVLVEIEVTAGPGKGYDIDCEVVGAVGLLRLGSHLPAATVDVNGCAARPLARDWFDRFRLAYESQLASWACDLAERRTGGGASAWDGYLNSLVLEACLASLAARTEVPIDPPERPALYA